MIAGVAIDTWKLAIFEKHLKAADYHYEVGPGLTTDTMFLRVSTTSADKLHEVILAANTEAAESGGHS